MHKMHVLTCLSIVILNANCAHLGRSRSAAGDRSTVALDPLAIQADLELAGLNDEELFASATSFFAAEDYKQAARYFGRICDFHPNSPHRRSALYNAGLALEKLKLWDEALVRFAEIADSMSPEADAIDASFRVAEVYYHLDRFGEASRLLSALSNRSDLSINKRFEARTQLGICQLEWGDKKEAEKILRDVLSWPEAVADRGIIDDYFIAQAQFFLGEIFRLHYESLNLNGNDALDKLAETLEYKSELLLSSQGHYLRAIRVGNGYWATAAGQRIGGLYENMYEHLLNSPAPNALNSEEQSMYRAELRKKIRVLISKAINVYERNIEAAERIGASSPFVEQTRASLKRMKDLLLADARAEENNEPSPPLPGS